MKTFETEKHNIPKGATHYWNESCKGFFAWWNDNTKEMLCPDGLGSWCRVSDLSDEILHEIPKPRTKTEFVKVESEFAWELVKEFEEGVEFYTCSKGLHTSKNIGNMLSVWHGGDLHRKVETEIDERQEFIDVACEAVKVHRKSFPVSAVVERMYDSGKFKLVEK